MYIFYIIQFESVNLGSQHQALMTSIVSITVIGPYLFMPLMTSIIDLDEINQSKGTNDNEERTSYNIISKFIY